MQGVFDGIIGADSMGDVCKPELAAFQRAVEISGANPASTAMFEDSFKNLQTAKSLGMTTVMVAGETAAEENVTRCFVRSLASINIYKFSSDVHKFQSRDILAVSLQFDL